MGSREGNDITGLVAAEGIGRISTFIDTKLPGIPHETCPWNNANAQYPGLWRILYRGKDG